MHFIGRVRWTSQNGAMDDHEIKQVIYGLVAISAVFSAALAAGVLLQLHAEGSEFLSLNSWLNYFSKRTRVI